MIESFFVSLVFMVAGPVFDLVVWHAAEDGTVNLCVVLGNGIPGVEEEDIVHRVLHAVAVDLGPFEFAGKRMRFRWAIGHSF